MEAFSIVAAFRKKGEAPSTEKRSLGLRFKANARQTLGLRYEAVARRDLISRGYSILKTNWHWGWAEIDILAEKPAHLLVVEVRGKISPRFRPSRVLSLAKKKRLIRVANVVCRRYRRSTRIELIEIIGVPERGKVFHYEITED